MSLDVKQAHDALCQALETESAAAAVYDAALACATRAALRDAWKRQRDLKRASHRDLEGAVRSLALDVHAQTPSRHVARHLGQSLVCAVKMACQSAAPANAEVIAAQCVVHAEMASRQHWLRVQRIAQRLPGAAASGLRELAQGLDLEQEEQIEQAEAWLEELSQAVLGLPNVRPALRAADATEPTGSLHLGTAPGSRAHLPS
jgi:hypothetical protein